MKIVLSAILILTFVFNSFASPLIFKVTKEVKGNEFVEFATIDTAKYKQIKIAVDATADENVSENLAVDKKFSVQVYGVEAEKEIFLESQYKNAVQFRTLIDLPPSKIRIKVKGETTYTVHIWATQ